MFNGWSESGDSSLPCAPPWEAGKKTTTRRTSRSSEAVTAWRRGFGSRSSSARPAGAGGATE